MVELRNGKKVLITPVTDEDLADIGFALLPSKSGAEAPVTLGAVCSFSINSK